MSSVAFLRGLWQKRLTTPCSRARLGGFIALPSRDREGVPRGLRPIPGDEDRPSRSRERKRVVAFRAAFAGAIQPCGSIS